MSQLFSNSGQFEDLGVSAPTLQNQFIPAIDKAEFVDGFRIVVPLGGGKTQRNFLEYGLSAEVSSQETQINDLSSLSLTPASYSFEGLVGPQGPIGPKGDPGKVIVQQILFPFTGMVGLDDTLEQIEGLGETIANAGVGDKIIYVSSVTEHGGESAWGEKQPAGDTNYYWNTVAMDSDGSNLIAAANTGRLYTSDDSGTTWEERQPAGDTSKNWNGVASDSDGSNLIAAASSGRLYTSSDSGETWIERQPAGAANKLWNCVASDSDGSNLMAAIGGGRLYTSSDSGVNWTERQPAGNNNRLWEHLASNSDGSVLIAIESSDGWGGYGRIWVSQNSGSSWTERRPIDDDGYDWYGVACDYTGAKIVVCSLDETVYRSINYGANWSEITPEAEYGWFSIASNSDGTILILGASGGRLYTSDNSGTTWEEIQPKGDDEGSWYTVGVDSDGSDFIAADYGGRLYVKASSVDYYTENWSSTDLTSFARSLIDDEDAASAATTIGLGTTDSPSFANLTISDNSSGNVLVSNPQSGEHRIKGLRLSATGDIIVTYDSEAEP
jgi:photosystem II stability/assembly factor-like uncharacterized protein